MPIFIKATGETNETTQVFLAATPTNIFNESGGLITNFIARTVRVGAPQQPGISVKVNDEFETTVTANADYTRKVASVNVSLRGGAWPGPGNLRIPLKVTVKDNPALDVKDYMALSSVDVGGYRDWEDELFVQPNGESATLSLYLYANRGSADTANGLGATFRYRLDENVIVSLELAFNAEFGEMEYTVWFENTGKAPSKVLRDVYAIDTEVTGAEPVLRGCLGDHANFYAAYEHDLRKGTQFFRSDGGRATHVVFPYFDFVHGDGGTLIALGWAGTWNAMFSPQDDFVTLKVQTCNDFNAALLPGVAISRMASISDFGGFSINAEYCM